MAHLGIEIRSDSPKSPVELFELCTRRMCFMECVEKLRVHCLNIGLEKALDCKV